MGHTLMIIDFVKITERSSHVKITGFDAVSQQEYEGEVRFMDNLLYGDIIHPTRSFLSPDCRQYVWGRLMEKHEAGDFD